MAVKQMNIVDQINLEQENEILEYKVELLTHAVRELQELMQDSAGVYWDGTRDGMRHVGNLSLKRWHEMDESIVFLTEAFDMLESEQEDN